MGILNPDLSEALEMGAIAEGTYKGKVVEANPEPSKKGNPMCVIKAELEVDGKKRTRKAWLPVSGEGAGGFDQLLRACHFDELADKYKDPSVQPKPPFDTDQLIGQELQFVIQPNYFQRKDNSGNPIGDPELRDQIRGYLKL